MSSCETRCWATMTAHRRPGISFERSLLASVYNNSPWSENKKNSCVDPEGGGQGVRTTPLKNHKNKKVSWQYWSRSPEKSQSYQASIQCWAIIGTPAKHHLNGILLASWWWPDFSGIWIHSLTQKKSWTPSEKTFWICALCFQRKTMSPKLQIELAIMFTALYFVTMIQAEIHQLFQRRACTNTILVKLWKYKVLWLHWPWSGLWKYHARLVRPGPISFRTSWKFQFTCPWTSAKFV